MIYEKNTSSFPASGRINEKDIVYDCFSGSGTTLKMANKYNRNWIGSELSEEYCEVINKRIIPYISQTNLFHCK